MADEKSEHEVAQKTELSLNDFWQDEVLRARKRSKNWRDRASETVKTYRGITDDEFEFFNILWSNTETLKGAVYSHTPRPEVTRRFLEDDPEGNSMAMVMERCLSYCQGIKNYEFDRAMKLARDDYLLAGRGTVRVRYDAEFEDEVTEGYRELDEGGVEFVDDVEEKKVWEEAFTEHVTWRDFEHSFGKKWCPDVWWTGFARDMTRDELIEKFGPEAGKKIPLNGEMLHDDWEVWHAGETGGDFDAGLYDWYDREDFARVWEIWDKRSKTVVWISEANNELIMEEDDPYGLEGFFPCPEPMVSVKTTDTLEPVPEYTLYQYQAEELNVITRRLTRLTEALKAVGVCDAEIHSLTRLFDGEDNEIMPDEEFGKLASAGGTEKAIEWLPIAVISDVIGKLSQRRSEVKEEIYELTGISDIIRGQSDPRETATAVRTKGRFGTLRIQNRQKDMQVFARDAVRLMGGLIAELFDTDTLIMMSGVENREDIVAGMNAMVEKFRDEDLRDYTIDIETDSTIAINEQQQKQDVTEFFGALAPLMQQLIPAVQQGILPMQAAKAMLMYAANRFNAGRDLTAALESIGSQPPKQEEDPAKQAAQMKQQVEMGKLKLQQAELEMKKQKMEMDAQVDIAKIQIEMQKLGMDFESTKLKEQVKVIVARMDIDAAKANLAGSN